MDRQLRALIKFTVDQSGLNQAKTAVNSLAADLNAAGKKSTAAFGAGGSAQSVIQQQYQTGQAVAQRIGLSSMGGKQITSQDIIRVSEAYSKLNSGEITALQTYRSVNQQVDTYNRELARSAADKEKAAQAAEKLSRGTGNVEKSTKAAAKEVRAFRSSLRALSPSIMLLTGLGAAIVAPMTLAANKYVSAMGVYEDKSKAYIQATNDMERAQVRFGRATIEALQPTLDFSKNVMNFVADLAEANPTLTKVVFGIGEITVAVGGAAMAVLQLTRAFAGLKLFLLSSGLLKAGGAAAAEGAGGGFLGGLLGGGAAATLGIGAGLLAGGAALGAGAYYGAGAIIDKTGGAGAKEKAGWRDPRTWLSTVQPTIAYGWSRLTSAISGESEEEAIAKANRAAIEMAKVTGALDDTAYAAADAAVKLQETATGLRQVNDAARYEDSPKWAQAVNAYKDYQNQIASATKQYEAQKLQITQQYEEQWLDIIRDGEKRRLEIVQNYNKQLADLQSSLGSSLASAWQSYRKTESKATEQYNENRRKLAEQYGKETEQAEKEHQKRMLSLQKDHDSRMEDLIASRDALGMIREMRSYERQRTEEEENYRDEQAQRKQEYADQLSEMQEQFQMERAERREELEDRIKELRAEFEERKTELDKQYKEQLDALKKSTEDQITLLGKQKDKELALLKQKYGEQLIELNNAFNDRIRELDATLLGDYAAYQTYLANIANEFKKYLADPNNQKFTNQSGYNAPGTPSTGNAPTTGSGSTGTRGVKTMPGGWKMPYGKGGYAGYGQYTLGDEGEEFVMTNQATRAAERLIGSRLSQERLISALSGGNRYSNSRASISVILNVQSSLNDYERKLLRRDVGKQIEDAFESVIRGRSNLGWSNG